MHCSLVYAATAAILAVVFPLVSAQGTLPNGTYRLENLAFDSLSPKRLLDLKERLAAPGSPIIVFMDNGGDNQHWNVRQFGSGYNVEAVAPLSNAFVASLSVGSLVTGTPDDKTTFVFNKVADPNIYQIIVASDNETFAIQSTTDGGSVTLGFLNATNLHQTWRLCPPKSLASSTSTPN